jgi:hypothetical protein
LLRLVMMYPQQDPSVCPCETLTAAASDVGSALN